MVGDSARRWETPMNRLSSTVASLTLSSIDAAEDSVDAVDDGIAAMQKEMPVERPANSAHCKSYPKRQCPTDSVTRYSNAMSYYHY
jgi:hypothetical protein